MREVYNGYTEKFLTGAELKEMFSDGFYCDGKHHETVYDITIPEYLTSLKLKEDKEYRIFYNNNFCKIMNAKTDKNIDFFGYMIPNVQNKYISNRNSIKHRCPNCESEMIIKFGTYGPFWSCSNYPNCKGSEKASFLGYYAFEGFKVCKIFNED